MRPAGLADLGQHRLQPLLELAAVLGAGQQRAHVQRPHAAVLQALGHVTRGDALGQALDDRGLADAGLADQHRVVLGAAGEHLDHTAHLLVAPDHRIELAALGQVGEVAAELLERRVVALGVGRGGALAAAHVGHGLQQRRAVEAAGLRQRQQQVLDGHVLVLQGLGLAEGRLQRGPQRAAGLRLGVRALHPRQPRQLLLQPRAQGGRALAGLLQDARRHAPVLVDEGREQVLGRELGVAAGDRVALRGGERLLCLDRQLLEVHRSGCFAGV